MTDRPWIAGDRPDEIQTILRELNLVEAGEAIEQIAPAGDGNMNLTLRVRLSSGRSLIVKQSRPWVEKYPSIEAPVERMDAERRFYEKIAGVPALADAMPELLAASPKRYVLCLEDLGSHSDMSAIYQGRVALNTLGVHMRALGGWLTQLHRVPVTADEANHLRNRSLRRLNHEHIFVIPFAADSDLELDSVLGGLNAVSQRIKSDSNLRDHAAQLGEIYLSDGPCLLHGDFFPGSWLETPSGVRVIDPEFGHYGRPEFDVAVTLAHLRIAGCDEAISAGFLDAYHAHGPTLATDLVDKFQAVEVLRRLVGVAQLPLKHSLERIEALVDEAAATLR